MKHLLDVNVLIAAIWQSHSQHLRAKNWLSGRQVVLCPVSEMGFLRISTHPRAYGLPMNDARKGLESFAVERKVERIDADLKALDSHASTSDEITDHYLADLAARHSMKFATFDAGIKHPSVELVK